jgi:hypothetical protein
MRESIKCILSKMAPLSRLGLVLYGSGQGVSRSVSMNTAGWSEWTHVIGRIKPLGCNPGFSDLGEALNVTKSLLDQRKSPNPVSTIYFVSDSMHAPVAASNYVNVLETFLSDGVPIHSFGVGINHNSDMMARTASMTGGMYCYIRQWQELVECIKSRAFYDSSIAVRDVSISLQAALGTRISSVSGTNMTASVETLNDFEGSPPSATVPRLLHSGKEFPTSSTGPVVRIGNVFSGQDVSFLVQVAVSEKCKDSFKSSSSLKGTDYLPLFTATASYRTLSRPDKLESGLVDCKIQVSQDDRSDGSMATNYAMSSFPQTPSSLRPSTFGLSSRHVSASPAHYLPPLTPTTPITPSPLFADIVLANEEFPLILATEKHNLTVTQRKLELVAVEALEIALQQSATGNHQDAYRTLEEVRPFLRGTFEAAVLGPEDREAAQFHTIQQSIDVLDDTLGVVANSVRQSAAFDSDVRSWVIQTVGVLRSRVALSCRSRIESDFMLRP